MSCVIAHGGTEDFLFGFSSMTSDHKHYVDLMFLLTPPPVAVRSYVLVLRYVLVARVATTESSYVLVAVVRTSSYQYVLVVCVGLPTT